MYKMNDGWTDERMDDFRGEVNRRFDGVDRRFSDVDRRFDKVDGEIRDLRSEMQAGFDDVNSRFVGLYRAQFVVGGGIIAALIGVIATQI
jgi:hypothetical protein